MQTCLTIVHREPVLILSNFELGATDSSSNATTSSTVVGILITVAKLCEIVTIQRNLLHCTIFVFELARVKHGSIGQQSDDKTIAAVQPEVPGALNATLELFYSDLG